MNPSSPKKEVRIVSREESRVITAAILDARTEAESIREAAQAEARSILETACAEANAIKKEASDERIALREGLLAELNLEVARERAALEKQYESFVVELVAQATESVVRQTIQKDREAFVLSIREAMAKIKRATQIKIELHPDDLQMIGHPNDLPLGEDPLRVQLQADATLTRGDVVLRSNLGGVDARIESKMRAMEGTLRQLVRDFVTHAAKHKSHE